MSEYKSPGFVPFLNLRFVHRRLTQRPSLQTWRAALGHHVVSFCFTAFYLFQGVKAGVWSQRDLMEAFRLPDFHMLTLEMEVVQMDSYTGFGSG